jgi:hypothetical protein
MFFIRNILKKLFLIFACQNDLKKKLILNKKIKILRNVILTC